MMSNTIFEGNYCEQNDDNEMDADTYTEEVVGGEILEPVDNVDGNIFADLLSQVAAMDKHIDNLIKHNVTSIRKHQQMIELVLGNALSKLLIQATEEVVLVTEDMFNDAEQTVLGTVKTRMGFC